MSPVSYDINSDLIRPSFNANGFVSVSNILDDEKISYYKEHLIKYLEKIDWKLDVFTRHKPHLLMSWAYDLAREENIVKTVCKVLGTEDVLMWYSVVFVKPAKSEQYVAWHQDGHYWAMKDDQGLTAWVALTDVDRERGGMLMIPGSHLNKTHKHVVAPSETNNLLHRGQKIVGIDESNAVPINLNAGDVSFHDLRTLHMSGANKTDQPRLALAFRYIPATNYPVTLKWLKRSAVLVNGRYDFKKFNEDLRPSVDFSPEALKAHRQSVRVAALHSLFGDKSRSGIKKAIDSLPIILSKRAKGSKAALQNARD